MLALEIPEVQSSTRRPRLPQAAATATLPGPGNLVGIAPEDVRVAMPITIGYQEIPSEDITIWRWVALG